MDAVRCQLIGGRVIITGSAFVLETGSCVGGNIQMRL